MRITIERMRTLVLTAGVLLVAALVVFLVVGKWKNPFSRRDLPSKLGLEIQQEANGWTYTHNQNGHTLYKIHASKLVQLKQGNHVQLHDVKIELYGPDGSRVDRIEGNEFEWDPLGGTANATGAVEITLMRPGEAPAIAPKALGAKALSGKSKPLASVAETAAKGEIHVKTTGLSFDKNSGIATTTGRVDFTLAQGTGSAIGATYNSEQGHLVLERAVELTTRRGTETVVLHAQHGEYERDSQICQLRTATANYDGGAATAGEAKILFRSDGSASRLDATNGFALATQTGSHVAAATGVVEFDEKSQPHHAHLEGGVTLDSASQNGSQNRTMHGTSPTAELEFTQQGQLRQAHLERGVEMHSEELNPGSQLRVSRTWRSPVAEVEFRPTAGKSAGAMEISSLHGTGGVVVTGESQRGKAAVVPSRLAADEVIGSFGAASTLTELVGVGHASIDETSATGTRQTTSGNRLEAHFAAGAKSGTKSDFEGAAEIQSATVEGHVMLTQTPAPKLGIAAAPLRAWAGKAVYEGAGQWLHLTVNPRVEDGALQLASDKIDVSQESGDAFAHGNVKASWLGGASGQSGATLGGQGPAHVVAAEAQLHQATNEATFRGKARLWQQANSIAAPVIVLDRAKQTLTARTTTAADSVRAVLVSSTGASAAKTTVPSVIRLRGGDLWYSDAERKGVMHGGILGNVLAESGTTASTSSEVELVLSPTAKSGATGASQVDRIIARGKVIVTSEGRRGTGEQLVYSSATGEYVLTGTAAAPPKMTDPARGSVTGQALIFHAGDESVSVEGGGQQTRTETTAPKR